MKYKSLLLDVDGTLVPVGPHTIPSEKVIESLKRAKEHVGVSIVSGRPINWLTDLFKVLELTDPCIINGGSQIVDPETGNILWERPIEKDDIKKLFRMIDSDKIPFLINDNGVEYKNPTHREFEKPLALQMTYFDSKESSDEYLDILKYIPGISAHKFFSWDQDRNYKMEVYITHKEATKQEATQQLAQIMDIDTTTMIGVGDSRNDIPFLNACGLRIAMGNADTKLKAGAHHVVPPVEEDGVAFVVENFILSDSLLGQPL